MLLLAAALPLASVAQSAPAPPPLFQFTYVQVKPGMDREYIAYLKSDANPALKKAGVTYRDVWETATFGIAGQYVLVQRIDKIAQYDENALQKALGEVPYRALLAKRATLIVSARSVMITAWPEGGFDPAAGYKMKLAVLSTNSVAPGRVDEYRKHAAPQVAVMKKTNAKGVLAAAVGLGGSPGDYVTATLFDSFADLSAFPAAYAKASADAKLQPQAAGIVMHTEWRVIRYLPDVSIIPAPAK
jgi:hypothetical protein